MIDGFDPSPVPSQLVKNTKRLFMASELKAFINKQHVEPADCIAHVPSRYCRSFALMVLTLLRTVQYARLVTLASQHKTMALHESQKACKQVIIALRVPNHHHHHHHLQLGMTSIYYNFHPKVRYSIELEFKRRHGNVCPSLRTDWTTFDGN